MARRPWKRWKTSSRLRKSTQPKKYGAAPSVAQLHKSENKRLASTSSIKRSDFVFVAWKAGVDAVNDLQQGKLKATDLWSTLQKLIEANSPKVKPSLAHHKAVTGKVGFYVPVVNGVYKTPELRVVCTKPGVWSHFCITKERKRKHVA